MFAVPAKTPPQGETNRRLQTAGGDSLLQATERRQSRRKRGRGAAKKAHGVCRPGRDKLSEGKLQSFLPYFLCLTKSRAKPPKGTSLAACRQRSREAAKGFNWVSVKLSFEWADSRFAEPRNSLRGNGFILFACTKRTGSTPEVCEPLDSGDDSNLRSIHSFR